MTRADELKKEAEEYAEQCYGWCNNDQVTDVAIATYITSAEPREKRIAELEKENAELKEKITFLGDLVFKARDLAKDVMTFYPACTKSVYNKAKEFLE
jgi:hypothetical protein